MNTKKFSLAGFIFYCCISLQAQTRVWTLKECIDTTWQRNISLRGYRLGIESEKINLEQSKENLLPNLNATDAPAFNYAKTLNPNAASQYLDENTTTNSFALTSSVTLFNGFNFQNTIKQNKFIYDAGVQNLETIKNYLSLSVLASYLQVIASYEQVDIANSQLATDSIQAEQTKKQVDAGKYPILNLLQILSQMANDKFTKVNAETQLQLAKVNLMQLMNIPVVNDFEVKRPEINDEVLSVSPLTTIDIYKTAETIMPQIKSAQMNVSASEVGIKVAQSTYMPKLTLSGSIRTSGTSLAAQEIIQPGRIGYLQSNPADQVIGLIPNTTLNNNFSNLWTQLNNNFNQVIGINLTIPIFNNFQAKNNTALARINRESAQLGQDSVKINLRQSIEQAHTQLLAASSQYVAAKEALTTEKLTYENIEKKFEIGTSSATDYLIEKSNYLKAEQNVIQTKYNYFFKIKLSDFYLGKPIIF